MEAASNLRQSTVETEEFWQHHKKMQESTELSRAAYCRQNGLNYFRFSHWVKLSRQNSSASKLVSIKLKPTADHAMQKILCTLELGSGMCLKIHDTQTLLFILERMG